MGAQLFLSLSLLFCGNFVCRNGIWTALHFASLSWISIFFQLFVNFIQLKCKIKSFNQKEKLKNFVFLFESYFITLFVYRQIQRCIEVKASIYPNIQGDITLSLLEDPYTLGFTKAYRNSEVYDIFDKKSLHWAECHTERQKSHS